MRLLNGLLNLPVDVFVPGEEGRCLAKIIGIQGRAFVVTAPARSNRLLWPRQDSTLRLVFPTSRAASLSVEGIIRERRLVPVPLLVVEVEQRLPIQDVLGCIPVGGRVVVVTGGKGGTGKTFVSINLAFLLARQGHRTALLDCDWGTANIDLNLGILAEGHLGQVFRGEREIHSICLSLDSQLDLYPGKGADPGAAHLTQWDLARFLGVLADLERKYAFVILDSAPGLGRDLAAVLLAARDVILVLNDTPSAIVDAYGVLKAIRRQTHLPRVFLVMNRYGPDSQEAVQRFQEVSREFLGEAPVFLGPIREDPHVPMADRQRRPLVLHSPQSLAALDLKVIAGRLAKPPEAGS
ncbi:MAG: MinD/ParA family protein [Firmicutes bacterium]|nr:MinD/ParA family protein [Bacillota bacterium]